MIRSTLKFRRGQLGLLALLVLTPQLEATPAAEVEDHRPTSQAAVRAADQAYNAAAKGRDREAFHALLLPDALFFADQLKRGRIDYMATWTPMFEGKYEFRYLGESLDVVVAESADLAWSVGHAETSFVRPGSEEATKNASQYMTVWQSDASGSWKVLASATLVVHPELGSARDPRSGLMTAWPELADQIDAAIQIQWTPEKTLRAASGELACTWGAYHVEFKQESGTVAGSTLSGDGHFLAVWEKDPEGRWQLAGEGFTPPQIHSP